MSPAASGFRDMLTAASRYGLTEGNYNSEVIELTDLGVRFTQPTDEGQALEAARQAIRNVPIFGQLLGHYKNSKLPTTEILRGILEKPPFNVAEQWSKEVAEIFTANGKNVGFVREVSGSTWVLLDAGKPAELTVNDDGVARDEEEGVASPPVNGGAPDEIGEHVVEQKVTEAPTADQPSQGQFFIAFGKDRQALNHLQTMLNELGIPYLVAEEEAHAGRPISEKVADLMQACSAGIFIFSADDKFEDKNGDTVYKPRENVIFELGAASLLYGRRIVIFKEEGVSFPTDFRDLGYIEYEKGNIAAKSIQLLKELVALKAIKIQAGR